MKGGFYSRAEIEGIVQKIRSPNLPFGAGKVVSVDGYTGSDGYDGDDPAKPLATITEGLVRCRDWKDDYVVVINTPSAAQTYPIVMNKNRVHIIGLGDAGKIVRLMPATDLAVIQWGAVSFCEIAGLYFGGGATHGAIEFPVAAAGNGRSLIRDCWFSWFGPDGGSQDGIRTVLGGDYPNVDIERCRFGEGLIRDGFRQDATVTMGVIRDCLFRKVPGIGIHIIHGRQYGAILNNRFMVAANGAKGCAITMEVNAGDALIDGNHAAEACAVPGACPFVDYSTGDADTCYNAWGLNYKGDTATYPDVT